MGGENGQKSAFEDFGDKGQLNGMWGRGEAGRGRAGPSGRGFLYIWLLGTKGHCFRQKREFSLWVMEDVVGGIKELRKSGC